MSSAIDVTITVSSPRHVADTSIQAKVAAVDLSSEVSSPVIDLAIDPGDATVVLGAGIIQRTFRVTFTADFIAAYPTDALQLSCFQGMFRDAICTQVPADPSLVAVGFAAVP